VWYRKEGWAEQLQALEERRDKAGQVYLEQLPGNQERAMIAAQSNVVAAVQTPPARNRLGTIVRRQPAQNGGASPAG
jgi:hypothetical protein